MQRELAKQIVQARSTKTRPHTDRLTAFESIADLLSQRIAETPAQEFLVYFDGDDQRQAWTYAAFGRHVDRLMAWLARNGIGHGDRIATISANHGETVVQYLAAWRLGAVVVPVNVGEDDERISYILTDSGAKLAFVRDAQLVRILAIRSEAPGLNTIVCAGEPAGDLPHLATILADTNLTAPTGYRPHADSEALIVYTSGTTGNPKGVVLTQYNLLVDADNITAWHGMKTGDRMLCVLPIHHVNGTVVTLLTPLYFGGTVVLVERFNTGTFFMRLESEQINVVSVVPTLLALLLQTCPADFQPDLPFFRHIICGAGPLTVELAMQFQTRFGLRIVHGYGLSETTCYSCFLPVDLNNDEQGYWLSEFGFPSIGVPLPANDMAIVSADGIELPAGERGEIVIRGHNVMLGYFQNDEANSRAFTHGWFRSGDEGFWQPDQDGRRYFFITGRLKELIIRGGVNVSPLEIDEVLVGLPGVKAGVAVGFANDVYGEEIGAFVVMEEGGPNPTPLASEDVLAACREVLPHHKCPKVVVFGDAVPATSTGKYQRNKLKELFAEWQGMQFRKGGEAAGQDDKGSD